MNTKILRGNRRWSAMMLIVSAAMSAAPALAATDTRTGTNGADGADGTVVNNGGLLEVTEGQPGGGGGSAISNAYSNDPPNVSVATGGNGGKGGDGASEGALSSTGGNGGAGGNASAASQQLSYINADASDHATATGGDGGDGGNGGTQRFGPTAHGGDGGNGGSASAAASSFSSTSTYDPDTAAASSSATASATGGNGGNGGSSNGAAGDGGHASLGTVSAISSGGGRVGATGTVHGGNGGNSVGTSKGGDGASESLSNAVSASSSGALVVLEENAFGGNSGASSGGLAGLAGSASSSFSFNQTGLGTPRLVSIGTHSTAGNTGASHGTSGVDGAAANASVDLTYSAVTLTGEADATGGAGGDLSGGSGIAGVGGSATTVSHVNRLDFGGAGFGDLIGGFSTASSTGGKGGSITGSASGTAGAGGDAFSNATLQTHAANPEYFFLSPVPSVEADSFAGAGGDVTSTAGGNAGAGGNATGTLTASATADMLVTGIQSIGGNGGSVTGTGNGNGGAGGGATFTQSVDFGASFFEGILQLTGGKGGAGRGAGFAGGNGASPTAGTITLSGSPDDFNDVSNQSIDVAGGNGGFGANGAKGGNGADAVVNNPFNLSTTSRFRLKQSAWGGNAGGTDGTDPGTNGNAASIFNQTINGSPSLEVQSLATGGGGAVSVQNINGPAGGNADSSLTLTADHDVTGMSQAGGGIGSSIYSGQSGFNAGRGGNANADANVTGTGAGLVKATSQVTGGIGGMIDASIAGNGGNGGDSSASAEGTGNPGSVAVIVNSTGGAGGQGSGFGFSAGSGGNAVANATGTGNGAVTSTATASGGAVGAVVNNAVPGVIGTANATALATSLIFASANATATGPSGSATTSARATSTGLISFVNAGAMAPVETSATAHSLAVINQDAAFFTGPNAQSYASGNPTDNDVTSHWQNATNVRNAFGADKSKVDAVLQAAMQFPTDAATSHLYSTSVEINENSASLNSNGLIIGASGAQLSSGMQPGDSLRFRIVRNGSTVVDRTFLNNVDALNYFQDAVLSLGPADANLAGENLDLQLLLDLTSAHAGDGLSAQFVVGAPSSSVPGGVWNKSTGGSWAVPLNWSANTMPIGPGTSATFGSVITSAQTVSLDENTTVGSIQFNNPLSAYTIAPGAGGFSLNLDNAFSQSVITVINGHHTISAPINIASPGVRITVPAMQSLAASGGISGPGGITKFGDGSVLIGPMAVNGLDMQAGRIQFTPGASEPARGVGALAIAPGAVLDIADGKLITISPAGTWDGASSYTGVSGLVQSGRATGAGIITSSLTGPNDKLHAIGVAKASEIKSISDSATAIFAGQTVHGSDTLVMFTYGGDANLDGKINIDDYGSIDSHVGQSGTVFGWHNGDFNYDGKINIDDYGIIDGNIGAQGAPIPTIAIAPPIPGSAQLEGMSAVPEPGALSLIALTGAGLLRRRRCR